LLLERFLEESDLIEAGCDEAGRGCLAGPVVAAAVILDPKNPITGLNDSKKLSETKRRLLRDEIILKAKYWAVGECSNEEIDSLNILNASFLAMHKALDQIPIIPNLILVDGNRFIKYKDINHQCIVKGDGKYQSIAAASILAKTFRDEIMERMHLEYPHYYWDSNKGYPSPSHIKSLEAYGQTPYHRKTFKLKPKQLNLGI
jgi:ribonuclease HII